MKKILSLLLALFMLCVSLAGCNMSSESEKGSNQESGSNNSTNEDKKDNINLTISSKLETNSLSLYIDTNVSTGETYAYNYDWSSEKYILPDISTQHTGYIKSTIYGNYAWAFDVHANGITLYKISRLNNTVEVYKNIYPEDIGFTEMTFAIPSFYDENNGVLFFWRDNYMSSGWPVRFLSTNNGGETWQLYEPQNAPATSVNKQYPNFAKFLSENVGVVSYRYWSISDLCKRTYLTFDGGKTWERISGLEYSKELSDYAYSEVKDLYYTSSVYVLEVEISNGGLGTRETVYYVSQDLKTWELFSQK